MKIFTLVLSMLVFVSWGNAQTPVGSFPYFAMIGQLVPHLSFKATATHT